MTPEDLALKAATREMIRGVGGLEAAAPYCRVGKSVLGDNQSPNRPESFVAIDVVAALEPLARERDGWPHVTQALCQRVGGMFVPVPDVPPGRRDLCALLGEVAQESTDLTRALLAALADGRVDPHEVAAPRAEAWALLRAAATMIAALDAIGSGDGS